LVRYKEILVRRFPLLAVLLCLFATSLASQTAQAQTVGRSVNMVSGTDWTTGDPFLQRQNEPTLAVSTRNTLHLVGGANDYRSVDLAGFQIDRER
jgi:hypothetical protein